MGIKQLSSLLKKEAPSCLSDWRPATDLQGHTLAIDASPCLYQCLTTSDRVGQEDDTSHVSGLLRRTVRLLELGIRPIFVFDGEAPDLKKTGALSRREMLRSKSREQLAEAQEKGDQDAIRKLSVRLVKTTQKHNDDCIQVLLAMGVPALQAPSEAECLCCALVKENLADAVATEDFDALPFGAPRTVRFLHQSLVNTGARTIQFLELHKVLECLKYNLNEFVDLCILCGCDYLGTIPKVGPQTAHQLVTKHRSIETILSKLDRNKYIVPDDWDFKSARDWFRSPHVGAVAQFDTTPRAPQLTELRELLVSKFQLPALYVGDQLERLARVAGVAPAPTPSLLIPAGVASDDSTPEKLVASAPRTGYRPVPRSSHRPVAAARSRQPAKPLPGQRSSTPSRSFGKKCALPALRTLMNLFATRQPAEQMSEERQKRRRLSEQLAQSLGGDLVLPPDTPLCELEQLAAQVAAYRQCEEANSVTEILDSQ